MRINKPQYKDDPSRPKAKTSQNANPQFPDRRTMLKTALLSAVGLILQPDNEESCQTKGGKLIFGTDGEKKKLIESNQRLSLKATQALENLKNEFLPQIEKGIYSQNFKKYCSNVIKFAEEHITPESSHKSTEIRSIQDTDSSNFKGKFLIANLDLYYKQNRAYSLIVGAVFEEKSRTLMLAENFDPRFKLDQIILFHELCHAFDNFRYQKERLLRMEKKGTQYCPYQKLMDLGYEIRAHAVQLELFNMVFPEIRHLAQTGGITRTREQVSLLLARVLIDKLPPRLMNYYSQVILDNLFYSETYFKNGGMNEKAILNDDFVRLLTGIYIKHSMNGKAGIRDNERMIVPATRENIQKYSYNLTSPFGD